MKSFGWLVGILSSIGIVSLVAYAIAASSHTRHYEGITETRVVNIVVDVLKANEFRFVEVAFRDGRNVIQAYSGWGPQHMIVIFVEEEIGGVSIKMSANRVVPAKHKPKKLLDQIEEIIEQHGGVKQ